MNMYTVLFPPGRVVITRGVVDLMSNTKPMAEEQASLNILVFRHLAGDYGELGEGDKQTNKEALTHGGRIFSKYTYNGESIYIITESNTTDRVNDKKADNITTILLPEEY